MNLSLAHFLTSASAAAAGALISAIWQGAALAALVALCLRFAKGMTPAVRSLLWTATFTLAILLHLTPFLLHSKSDAVLGNAPHSAAALRLDARWSLAIAAVWLTLSLVRMAQLARSWIALRRIVRSAGPVESVAVASELLHAGRRTAILCTSDQVDRPSVLGFFQPRVLIPAGLYQQLSTAELEHIVLHEMEHLRRRDDWVNLFQKLALALFPLNPAMLWVERRLSIERELACDDHVLACTRARKTYATCLVNLAEHSVLSRRLSLALGAWERRSELARRVLRILHDSEGRMTTRRLRAVTAMLIAGMLAGTAELAREPRLVAFTSASATTETADAVDTVLPGAPSYIPANFTAARRPAHAVDAVYRVPEQPITGTQNSHGKSGSIGRPRQQQPQTKAVSLNLQHSTARITQLAQNEPPAAMTLPDSLAVSLRAHEERQNILRSQAVVVLATWTEYQTEEAIPSDNQSPDRSAAAHTSGARSRVHSQVQFLVARPLPPSYAAIPTPDGWLILQL
ncbi:M56 family metallopeptidase [Silvibacterium dinghuense]|uniref:M56 family metallopeptidase n=1 Tax=Silvibacterium dinghuense TaxID=1560006 RepID=A0A4Q1SGY4_9BACT|nr:M56 family metallopeptidase [Silvibacterium dinghuense]RXS96811.1 M56 family metallopeptidase [Silvibacterium dinghuense]GGG93833.1 hypothetical protein GCM10011586_05780 [Silvibacterium dinghuense]